MPPPGGTSCRQQVWHRSAGVGCPGCLLAAQMHTRRRQVLPRRGSRRHHRRQQASQVFVCFFGNHLVLICSEGGFFGGFEISNNYHRVGESSQRIASWNAMNIHIHLLVSQQVDMDSRGYRKPWTNFWTRILKGILKLLDRHVEAKQNLNMKTLWWVAKEMRWMNSKKNADLNTPEESHFNFNCMKSSQGV